MARFSCPAIHAVSLDRALTEAGWRCYPAAPNPERPGWSIFSAEGPDPFAGGLDVAFEYAVEEDVMPPVNEVLTRLEPIRIGPPLSDQPPSSDLTSNLLAVVRSRLTEAGIDVMSGVVHGQPGFADMTARLGSRQQACLAVLRIRSPSHRGEAAGAVVYDSSADGGLLQVIDLNRQAI